MNQKIKLSEYYQKSLLKFDEFDLMENSSEVAPKKESNVQKKWIDQSEWDNNDEYVKNISDIEQILLSIKSQKTGDK